MRVALVNDMKMALETLRRILAAIPDTEVAWMAEDGKEAVSRCTADTPDLILMDMIMPGMDGVEATRQIMQQCPCPILVVTATVTGNASRVYEALGFGALDAVNTPTLGPSGSLTGADELTRKINNVRRLTTASAPGLPASSPIGDRGVCASPEQLPPIVAIGASTGGPQALATILASLPKPLTCSVIIAQHVDEQFAPGLAQWLAAATGLTVDVARPGQRPIAGNVYVACTAEHMVVDRCGRLQYVREPASHVYRPSVDIFFDSLLRAPLAPGVAALLTGMGRDGAQGLKALRDAGWVTVAQDEATSVVWGMPGAAVRLDAAAHVLPVEEIGLRIDRDLGSIVDTNSQSV